MKKKLFSFQQLSSFVLHCAIWLPLLFHIRTLFTQLNRYTNRQSRCHCIFIKIFFWVIFGFRITGAAVLELHFQFLCNIKFHFNGWMKPLTDIVNESYKFFFRLLFFLQKKKKNEENNLFIVVIVYAGCLNEWGRHVLYVFIFDTFFIVSGSSLIIFICFPFLAKSRSF